MKDPLEVAVIGGGMITGDLILPSLYELQRAGSVGSIRVCALDSPPLRALQENLDLREAFPGQGFTAFPDVETPADRKFPDLYRELVRGLPKHQAVVVATPEMLHYEMVMEALDAEQHVLCVKPLVLTYAHSAAIRQAAWRRGLFVGVEYHKRFDRRALLARRLYAEGRFGTFAMGEARMIEPYYYRFSNFQNWFTVDHTDPFTYVGCHYVDLVHFITALKPAEVSVSGVRGRFPNGNEGYLWANGRVRWENGALLSVIDGLGYPDAGAGANQQGLALYCEGEGKSGLIEHEDQFRGITHCYLEGIGGAPYKNVHADFFKLVAWEGPGYKATGYGFESIAANLAVMARLAGEPVLKRRQEILREVDERGLIATPANSYVNDLVTEAGRLSIARDGEPVRILYGDQPRVELRA